MLPMGLVIASDVFQAEMGTLFVDMENVLVYIDDILVITKGSYEQHLQAVKRVLIKLKEAGMQLTIDKSFFAKDKVDYL